MSARSWTTGHPFDAGMTVPVFDRCLETVSQAHRYLTQTEQSSMQGGDQPDRRRMAFLGSQALLVAGQRPFRRPGRFVLGRVDVLQRRVAPARSVVAVHEQGTHTLDEVWRACERAAEHQVLLENLAQRVHV